MYLASKHYLKDFDGFTKYYKELTILFTCLALRDQISKIFYHFIGTFRFTFLNEDFNKSINKNK